MNSFSDIYECKGNHSCHVNANANQRNIFMFTAEIGLWQIFQLSIFVLSHDKYYYPGQRSDFRFFFSYFVLLPLLVTVSVRNTNFSFYFGSRNSRKSWHATLDWPDSADCDIKQSKNYRNIIRVFNKDFPALLRAGNPSETPQFVWWFFFSLSFLIKKNI